jgi:hypothetical protein
MAHEFGSKAHAPAHGAEPRVVGQEEQKYEHDGVDEVAEIKEEELPLAGEEIHRSHLRTRVAHSAGSTGLHGCIAVPSFSPGSFGALACERDAHGYAPGRRQRRRGGRGRAGPAGYSR